MERLRSNSLVLNRMVQPMTMGTISVPKPALKQRAVRRFIWVCFILCFFCVWLPCGGNATVEWDKQFHVSGDLEVNKLAQVSPDESSAGFALSQEQGYVYLSHSNIMRFTPPMDGEFTVAIGSPSISFAYLIADKDGNILKTGERRASVVQLEKLKLFSGRPVYIVVGALSSSDSKGVRIEISDKSIEPITLYSDIDLQNISIGRSMVSVTATGSWPFSWPSASYLRFDHDETLPNKWITIKANPLTEGWSLLFAVSTAKGGR